MKAIFINVKGISNGIYHIVPDIYHENWLELESADSIILKGTKSRSLGYNNTYRGYQ